MTTANAVCQKWVRASQIQHKGTSFPPVSYPVLDEEKWGPVNLSPGQISHTKFLHIYIYLSGSKQELVTPGSFGKKPLNQLCVAYVCHTPKLTLDQVCEQFLRLSSMLVATW